VPRGSPSPVTLIKFSCVFPPRPAAPSILTAEPLLGRAARPRLRLPGGSDETPVGGAAASAAGSGSGCARTVRERPSVQPRGSRRGRDAARPAPQGCPGRCSAGHSCSAHGVFPQQKTVCRVEWRPARPRRFGSAFLASESPSRGNSPGLPGWKPPCLELEPPRASPAELRFRAPALSGKIITLCWDLQNS